MPLAVLLREEGRELRVMARRTEPECHSNGPGSVCLHERPVAVALHPI
jgi:hypothetical protein